MKVTAGGETVTVDFSATKQGGRSCGTCTLCCKLVPVATISKPANQRCQHQRQGRGCAIYASRPSECAMWSCRWLVNPAETAGMHRPDRAHYLVDCMPDSIRLTNNETGQVTDVSVIQVWVDAAFPEAEQDPALRSYMLRMAREHRMPTLIRRDNMSPATVVFAPLNDGDPWNQITAEMNKNVGNYARTPEALRPPI